MLDNLFNPKSIAVIGAPREKGKLGFTVLSNILKLGFKGDIYPVNPKAKKILGLKCYSSILDIKENVDLAVVIVPAKIVPVVLKECGQKKVSVVIIISAGFKEIGGKGIELEKTIKKIAEQNNIEIVGPNCLGIINPYENLNVSFADGMPIKGKIGFASQSGAVISSVMDWAYKNNFGFSKIISFGNKAGLNESDFLEYFLHDEETKVVAIYIESIEEGTRFIEAARKIAIKKPVIVLKSGRTERSRQSVMSHTGVLCGEDRTFDAVFEDTGLIRVDTICDLFDLLKIFVTQPFMPVNNIAIVTNAGGVGVMGVDSLRKTNLSLSKFSKKTLKSLQKELPPEASVGNPVDIIGDAGSDRYKKALGAVLSDKSVDGAVVILTPQTVTEKVETVKVIADFRRKYKNKVLVVSFVGGKNIAAALKLLREKNIPNFGCPEEAIFSLEKTREYFDRVSEIEKRKIGEQAKFLEQKKHEKFLEIFLAVKVNKLKKMIFSDTEDLLKFYGISTVNSVIVHSENRALKAAKNMGYPIVLKTANDNIIHKSDIGGVKADIANESELKSAFAQIVRNANKVACQAKQPVLIQKQIKGKELIIGMKRDFQFGPVIMFGLGGIYTELFADTTLQVAPIDKNKALTMIKKIKSYKILKGARGDNPVNLDAIAEIICKVSSLALEFKSIKEIDINPLIVNEKEAKAVDVRIIV